MRHFVIDGQLSGTGIGDVGEGEYISPDELNLSPNIRLRIQNWLSEYELEHYSGYVNDLKIAELDKEGIKIADAVQDELPDDQIGYYSDAKLTSMHVKDICSEVSSETDGL